MGRGQHGAPSLALWGALLAGVAVTFPSFLMPGVADGSGPRTTDLLNLVCITLLVMAVFRSARLHPVIRGGLLLWAMTLPWVFMEICASAGAHDPPVQRVLIRWILCGGSAYLVTVLAEVPTLRSRFLYGLLIGIVLSSVTVLYDFLTFSPENLPIEQLVDLAIYNGKDIHDFIYRAYGIFGHPNGAAGCILLGVPIVIGAIEEGRLPRWSFLVAMGLMGGIFYLTKSRGPLIVSAVLLTYWLWSQTRGIRLLIAFAGVLIVLGVIAAGGFGTSANEGVLLDRFLDIGTISVNANDRWWTIATSLDLILKNPLGMGSAYVEPLEIATGTSATHNAYLELALMGGVPLMALVAIRLAKSAARLLTPRRPIEAWLSAYLIGIFMFESYFLQVNILFMTFWLTIAPLRSFKRVATHRAGTPMRSRHDRDLGAKPTMDLIG
ncbi:MAG: O-antigen ligase family protein [Proteobacteria bacterium]|nr:O-antigen ligase family protein [Pseudomonadota bacterium]